MAVTEKVRVGEMGEKFDTDVGWEVPLKRPRRMVKVILFHFNKELAENWRVYCRHILGVAMVVRMRRYMELDMKPFMEKIERIKNELRRAGVSESNSRAGRRRSKFRYNPETGEREFTGGNKEDTSEVG